MQNVHKISGSFTRGNVNADISSFLDRILLGSVGLGPGVEGCDQPCECLTAMSRKAWIFWWIAKSTNHNPEPKQPTARPIRAPIYS